MKFSRSRSWWRYNTSVAAYCNCAGESSPSAQSEDCCCLAALVSAVFAHYAQLPILERARCDQRLVPALRPFIAEEEANRRRLIALALGPSADRRRIDVATALTDASVHSTLADAGWSTKDAAAEIARIIAATLSLTDPPA